MGKIRYAEICHAHTITRVDTHLLEFAGGQDNSSWIDEGGGTIFPVTTALPKTVKSFGIQVGLHKWYLIFFSSLKAHTS